MDAANFLIMVRRYWRSIVVAGLIGGGLGMVAGALATPVYSSSAKVLFVGTDGPTVQLAVQSYADLAKTEAVLEPAAGRLGVDDYRELRNHVAAGAALISQIIVVTATDDEPGRAADIADAVAASVVEQADDDAAGLGEGVFRSRVVETATAAAEPVGSGTAGAVMSGVLAGLVLGMLVALVRWRRARARSGRE